MGEFTSREKRREGSFSIGKGENPVEKKVYLGKEGKGFFEGLGRDPNCIKEEEKDAWGRGGVLNRNVEKREIKQKKTEEKKEIFRCDIKEVENEKNYQRSAREKEREKEIRREPDNSGGTEGS